MGISVAKQIQSILGGYTVDVKRATNNSFDKVAKEGAKRLKAVRWKKDVGRGYNKGWAVKRLRGKLEINDVIIYNRTNPQLTHLLENGHMIVNGKGTFGRAPGYPHIKPVEEWAIGEIPAEIERELT